MIGQATRSEKITHLVELKSNIKVQLFLLLQNAGAIDDNIY
jgi:hypothetical protein